MQKTDTCVACHAPMWATPDAASVRCCMPCRRSLTDDQKAAFGVVSAGRGRHRGRRKSGVKFPSCVQCGELFCVSVLRPRKYCSDACREIVHPPRKRGPQPRLCRGCGVSFTPWHAGVYYCSTDCKVAANRKTSPAQPKPCAVCGVEFTPRNKRAKYCGAECRMDAQLAKAGMGRRELYDAYLAAVEAGQVAKAAAWIRSLMNYLAERDGTDCGICGAKVRMSYKSGTKGTASGLGPSVDHIVPRSVVPELASDLANLRLTHWRCNRLRRTRSTGTEQLALVG